MDTIIRFIDEAQAFRNIPECLGLWRDKPSGKPPPKFQEQDDTV